MTAPIKPKSPISSECLGSSSRQVIITGTDLLAGPVTLADYGGGPCRTIVLLGAGTLAYEPDSPADDAAPLITIPVSLPAFTALDIAVRVIDNSTTALPILVLF